MNIKKHILKWADTHKTVSDHVKELEKPWENIKIKHLDNK